MSDTYLPGDARQRIQDLVKPHMLKITCFLVPQDVVAL